MTPEVGQGLLFLLALGFGVVLMFELAKWARR